MTWCGYTRRLQSIKDLVTPPEDTRIGGVSRSQAPVRHVPELTHRHNAAGFLNLAESDLLDYVCRTKERRITEDTQLDPRRNPISFDGELTCTRMRF